MQIYTLQQPRAMLCNCRGSSTLRKFQCRTLPLLPRPSGIHLHARFFQNFANSTRKIPDFAFAFDIDGVLLRSKRALPRAAETLAYLAQHRIPYILLTNGGGAHESVRAKNLTTELGVQISPDTVIQSHTPFAEMEELKDKNVLVVGGEGNACKKAALRYGYKSPITPSDIYNAHPSIWPFSQPLHAYHASHASPASSLPAPILPQTEQGHNPPEDPLRIHAIHVYNDPRDWGLDLSLITDLLLSHAGHLGTLSPKNNDPSLPNRGYQQDSQPPLVFSNPDLWFASAFALPRLGQGGAKAALHGLWSAVTGGRDAGVDLLCSTMGKPTGAAYGFAERRLLKRREELLELEEHDKETSPLRTVYMIGDNPESDIQGAETYESGFGAVWKSVLVRSGVYNGERRPTWMPGMVAEGVGDAVEWAFKDAGWRGSD